MAVEEKVLLEVKNLKKYFPVKAGILRKTVGYVKAVDDVSFYINKRETLGLVGESGCGKSTIADTILRLVKATAGSVKFEGKDLFSLNWKELKQMRKKMNIIFQDSYSSLDPRMKIADIVGEPLDIHHLVKNKKEKYERVRELLDNVGLTSEHMSRYPHEFSGGQKQRIGIARALAIRPKLIIADEAVSSLDVSIQAQVVNLLQDLQNQFELTYLFIAHNLSVVKHVSDRIAVMYLGRIVEIADKRSLYNNTLHPYTKSLFSAILTTDLIFKKKRIILKGDIPSPVNLPLGCRFHTRCPNAMDICSKEDPEFKNYGNGHFAACHLLN